MLHDIDSNPYYKAFKDFKGYIDNLRMQFLVPVTCRPGKSILRIEDKEAFLEGVKMLKEKSKTLTNNLTSILEVGQLNTKDLLRKELLAFFKTNEPEQVQRIQNISDKERKINDIIGAIIASIKFK